MLFGVGNFLCCIKQKNVLYLLAVINMKLIIVRHADPDYVHDSLTEKGFREAEILKSRMAKLDVKEFYCSPLGRAVRTSEPTLKLMGRTAETLDWLQEFPGYVIHPDTGKQKIPWDFLPEYWTKNEDLYDRNKWIDTDVMKTGNTPSVYNSVISKFDKFLSDHGYRRDGDIYKVTKPNKDTIVFFCHFGIECVLLSRLLGVSPIVLWQGFLSLPTGVTVVQTEERIDGTAYFRCRTFGDVSHLCEVGETPSESGAFCEIFSDKDARH